MKKFTIEIEVDEETIRAATDDNDSSIESLINREMNWVNDSGIYFVGIIKKKFGKTK